MPHDEPELHASHRPSRRRFEWSGWPLHFSASHLENRVNSVTKPATARESRDPRRLDRSAADATSRRRDSHRRPEKGTLEHRASISLFVNRTGSTQEGLFPPRGDTPAPASAPGPIEGTLSTPKRD